MSQQQDDHPLVAWEPRILKARVLRRHQVTPRMVEITLGSEDLVDFPAIGPDAFIYVFVPRPGENDPRVEYHFTWDDWRTMDPAERPNGRYYTVRRLRPEAGEIDLHMVLHGDGPLTTWAGQAAAGDAVALWGPRAAYQPPDGDRWVLLAADAAGLPAAAAILESLPANAAGAAFIEVASEEEQQPLQAPAGVTITWLTRGERRYGEALMTAVRKAPLPEPDTIYAWAAADMETTAAIRSYCRNERGIPGRAVCAIGYWQTSGRPDRLKST